MKKGKRIFTVFNKVSAVFMILALLWLTVSTPFVFSAQQKMAQSGQVENNSSLPEEENEASNPFGNSTEEKVPSASSLSEEFLHDYHEYSHFFNEALKHESAGNVSTYRAYHGELLVPPPNVA